MAVIAGARYRVDDPRKTLKAVSELAAAGGIELQVFDASGILGREHLEIAAEKARRAFAQGRNLSNTLATEVLLYAAAERQISKAIDKLGLKEGTEELAVVIFGEADPSEILKELGWERDDNIPGTADPEELDAVIEGMALSELER